ncbi:sialidase family protein [uncultured Fibrella sp.]|uniref:sialidase family protein n=1 Tax=uncultured Fibrella sp. TaxID=1284596 RepID=UPI0035C96DF6
MKSILALLLLWITFFDQPIRETILSNPTHAGTTPRFTTDQRGNPVLSWAEKTSDKAAVFFFSVSTDGGETFGAAMRIPVPADLSTHAEGMPKIAIKGNGTLIALFEVAHPTTESPYAGNLYTMTSTNNGQSWTDPKPVHRDVTPGKSHSFGDLTRLPNGEVGLVWIDEKLNGQEGRCIKFVQTQPQGGFSPEIIVDSNACQCCRTNVFIDSKNQIHLTYRDLIPTGKSSPAARDMSRATSTDGGKTFGTPQRIYVDDWRVAACPHAGSSVAQVGNDLYTTWFSGKEGSEGVRLARAGQADLAATVPSSRAKHPQVVAYQNQLMWLWDESVRLPNQPADEPMPKFTQRIALRTAPTAPVTYLTSQTVSATYPVALATAKGLLVAFEQKNGDQKPVIVTQLIAHPQ